MLELLRSDDNLLGELLALVLIVAPVVLAAWGMRRGYRRQRDRDEAAFGAAPTAPAPSRAPDGEALYTGTTRAGSRLERVAVAGLFGRGRARYWLEDGRLLFQRDRGPLVAVDTASALGLVGAHAGRVVAPDRIAIVRWALGGADVDTGFAFASAEGAHDFLSAVAAATGAAAPDDHDQETPA